MWYLFALTTPAINAQSLHFENFSVDQGLSQNSVNSVAVDSFGLVWMATADGLNCYDGSKITQYHHNQKDSNTLHNDYIYSLMICEGQDIIIQGKEGIEIYERKASRFRLVLDVKEMSLTKISGLVIGADYSKLWVLNSDKRIIEIDKFNYHKKFIESNVLVTSHFESLTSKFPCKNGYFYFSDGSKLVRFNTIENKFQLISASQQPCFYAMGRDYNSYYILKQDSIIFKKLNGEIITRQKVLDYHLPNKLKTILVDGFDNIWLVSERQNYVLLYKDNDGRYKRRKSGNNITSIEQLDATADRAGNIWLATDGHGIYFLNHYKLIIENYAIQNNSLMVKSFCPISDHKILVGSVSDGLHIFDLLEKKLEKTAPLFKQEVYSLGAKNNQEIFVGTEKGIYIYDSKTEVVKPANLPGADELCVAKQLLVKGDLLYVSHINGITIYNLKTRKQIPEGKELGRISVHMIAFEPNDKSFFILTEYKGIQFYDGTNYSQIKPQVFQHQFVSIRHLYRQNESTYWFATERGLLKLVFHNGTRTKYDSYLYNVENGLPNNFIYSVLPGPNNTLWLSTNKGICSFNLSNSSCINYDIREGLQSNEFNTGAYYLTHSGCLLYGGVHGINIFNPKTLIAHRLKPNIHIKSLSSSNGNYYITNIPEKIEIPYEKNNIVVDFYSDDLSDPNKNKFLYMIEGIDKNWVINQGTQQLRYTGLEPGDYTLKLKTINGDGICSSEKKIDIKIIPPFWRTWFFIIMVAGILIIIIIKIVQRYSNLSIKKKNKELERQQEINNIRHRISSDLHDDIGSGLSKMALLSELAKSQTQNPEELQNKLSKLTDNSRDMIRSLGEIVWAINPQNDKLSSLLAYMRDYTTEYLETTNINIKYCIQETTKEVSINPDFKRNIFLVLKESLHNAVKYSEATAIEIGFTIVGKHYTFWVADNGKGIDTDTMRKFGQGLNSMKRRAENINSECIIDTEKDKGVKILLQGTLL